MNPTTDTPHQDPALRELAEAAPARAAYHAAAAQYNLPPYDIQQARSRSIQEHIRMVLETSAPDAPHRAALCDILSPDARQPGPREKGRAADATSDATDDITYAITYVATDAGTHAVIGGAIDAAYDDAAIDDAKKGER